MRLVRYFLLSALILTIILACSFVQIFDEPPGVGEKAEKGYVFSEPIIAALEKYFADNGSYPTKLSELVPDYLPAAPTTTEELDFSYSSTGDSYSFSFHYRGPGMNTCTFTSEETEWKCSGAY